jgi:phospho-N-acetylmuramoyl-pentapeptide-transferase
LRFYPTYTIFLTTVLSLVIIAALAPFWIRLLKSRGIGQNVRVDGPQGHLLKEGTPTMGGVLIITTLVVTFLLMGSVDRLAILALLTTVCCGLLGFADDASKVLKDRSLGLSARYKLLLLAVISIVVGLMAVNYCHLSTSVGIPLFGGSLNLGWYTTTLNLFGNTVKVPWLYIGFLIILISATTNTVNLTDGLDGLAAGTVTIVMLAYAGISFQQGQLDLALFAAAVGGACIGFLWYNSYPADIFMGDTGAIGLGGAVAAMAVVTKTELLLILIGGIYVIEGLSVLIQILVFRFTGRRVFKMAPIHHHFEMLGWSETKVMIRFWIVTGVLAGAGFALYFLSVT